MKQIEFKHGTVEVYETKEEMIGILSEQLGKDEVDWALKDGRFKDSFNPNTSGSHYIKKVIAIKVPDETHKTLMCFEHWNYERNWDLHKNVEVNMDTYSSGFACTVFTRPNEDKQKCFIEYYNTVRDDDRIEKILNTFKIGNKIYFNDYEDKTLSSETINYIGLGCFRELVVEVGTDERKYKFIITRINDNDKCEVLRIDKVLYTSLEAAKKSCLEELQSIKSDYKQRICNVEKKIVEAMSFVE